MRLSGRSHEVATGVAVFDGEQLRSTVVVTTVTFRDVQKEEAELLDYWRTCGQSLEPTLQGIGGVFVKSIQGSYSNVIGLPMVETQQLLISMGLNTWSQHQHV